MLPILSIGLGSVQAGAAPCPGSTQMALNACAAADLKRADDAMNAAYGTLMERIGPKAREGLRAAQKAWLPFRDQSCALEALGSEGGSIRPMILAGCLAHLTDDRTKTLRNYLTCDEGDLTCVGRFQE
ncbi:lysozyme inhibitor LprI family protein [Methylobacterium sp. J-068]|uniref:lysozyme inhibitor LprI family protein n=1 Tax=Methylobacterium sp. J-068 TaxID=2836649 RepID=UPI001FBAF2F1|nr:lysozyme inhibitor LprI family protein [Methylobacterium sp. J-068]MCJ2035778.1 lysozyme inhibitor LprI family protein [Methylobacterium sp. J-068]